MKCKVILDSCVLIAASSYYAAEDFEYSFKHRFFDKSWQLMGLVKKHISKRLGIVTATIENETHRKLDEAVMDTLEECHPSIGKETAKQVCSIVLNFCESRLNEILTYTLREPIPPPDKAIWFILVTNMYDELTQTAKTINPQEMAYISAGLSPQKYRQTIYEGLLFSITRKYEQIHRLLKNSPGPIDMEILAEAAYLNNFYKQTLGDVKTFIASTDFHFSPIQYVKTPESRIITDEIEKRFNIICHWPEQIAEQVKKAL